MNHTHDRNEQYNPLSRSSAGVRRIALILSLTLLSVTVVTAQETSKAAPKAAESGKSTVTVKGSDTMVILGQRWAEEFMKKNPGIEIQVMGGGSGTGIAALLNGSTDIAQASRPMKPQEKVEFVKQYKRKPEEIATALDGIAVFANKDNPVESLTLEQLKAIFRGEFKVWGAVGGQPGPIVLYGRENSSGTYAFFKEHVLEGLDFAPETQTLQGTAAIINAIAKDPRGIGYGGIGYSEGVKVLALQGPNMDNPVKPTEENVDSGKYPLARELYFYLDPEKHTGSVKAFIDFCLSPEGQKIVSEVGYYPLKSEKGKDKGQEGSMGEKSQESSEMPQGSAHK